MSGNSTYPVIVGDVWAYRDFTREDGWIEWEIQSVQDGQVGMIKLTGISQGFKSRRYELSLMKDNPKWRWVRGNAKPEVLFPCPLCEEDKSLVQGDYCCKDCRDKLDLTDEDKPDSI